MSIQTFKNSGRKILALAGLALGLTQVGCAHPVAVEPSVVISSRIGHAPVYAQIGIPAPVVVVPPPRVVYAPPPRVFHAPPVYLPAPAWGHGLVYGHGHGQARGQAYGHSPKHGRGPAHPGAGPHWQGRSSPYGWPR